MSDTPARSFGADPEIQDDDELGEPGLQSSNNLLTELAAELNEKVDVGKVTFFVGTRDGYQVRFRKDLSVKKLGDFRVQSKDRTQPDEIDGQKLTCLIVAFYCDAIIRNGQVVMDSRGKPMTFRSEEFQKVLGVHTARQAVDKFYGADYAIVQAANTLTKEAGLGDDALAVSAEDPT